ncbi:MAG: hypothetical protein WBV77_07215 [Solirubrobacteraceae bacterium]
MDKHELWSWFWLLGFWEFLTLLVPERLRVRIATTGAIVCGVGFLHAAGILTIVNLYDFAQSLRLWYIAPLIILVALGSSIPHSINEQRLRNRLRHLATETTDFMDDQRVAGPQRSSRIQRAYFEKYGREVERLLQHTPYRISEVTLNPGTSKGLQAISIALTAYANALPDDRIKRRIWFCVRNILLAIVLFATVWAIPIADTVGKRCLLHKLEF